MKDAYWFSHDANARNDIKHIEMRSLYGWEGYGWYWMIVEVMRECADYKLPCSKRTFYTTMATMMNCDEEKARQYITDCIDEFELFATDGNYIWSESLMRRMQIREEKQDMRSKAGRKAAAARWESASDTNGMQTHTERNTNDIRFDARERKLEKRKETRERKGKEKKEINSNCTEDGASEETDILFKQLDEAFLSQQPQQRFTNYGKERKHEKDLISKAMARAPDDPQEFLKRLLETFLEMTKNGDKFWKQQPFLPSVLNASGIFDRVLKQMENQKPADDLSWVDEVINDSKRVR